MAPGLCASMKACAGQSPWASLTIFPTLADATKVVIDLPAKGGRDSPWPILLIRHGLSRRQPRFARDACVFNAGLTHVSARACGVEWSGYLDKGVDLS